MRAVQIDVPGSAGIGELDTPVPDEDEVLVRVRFAGLCATDRKLWARGADSPRVPGHEVAGVLDDGSPVAVHPDLGCGSCGWCRDGKQNRCPDHTSIGLDRDGGLAAYVSAPRAHVVPLGSVPLSLAPMLEPLACCLHAVDRLRVSKAETAMVVGAGAMGILAMWVLRAHGLHVVVSERSDERRELARRLGADAICSPDDDPAAALGNDILHAVVTAPGADALARTLEAVGVGAHVHAFAGTPGGALVDANVVHYRHLDLVGSTGSGLGDLERARDLVQSGAVPLNRLPVEWVSLPDVPAALARPPIEPALKTMVAVEDAG